MTGGDAPPSTALAAQPETSATQRRLLLRLLTAVQEREHRYRNDEFHDGPVQDLTAVLLGLAALRRTLEAEQATRLAEIETQLREAITAARRPPLAFRAGNDARAVLESALAARVHGPLADVLDVVIEVEDHPPTRDELAELLAIVQTLLVQSDPVRPATHVAVTIRSGPDEVAVTVAATPAVTPEVAAAPETAGQAAVRSRRLRLAAEAVDATLTEDRPGGRWQAVARRGRPAGPGPAAAPPA